MFHSPKIITGIKNFHCPQQHFNFISDWSLSERLHNCIVDNYVLFFIQYVCDSEWVYLWYSLFSKERKYNYLSLKSTWDHTCVKLINIRLVLISALHLRNINCKKCLILTVQNWKENTSHRIEICTKTYLDSLCWDQYQSLLNFQWICRF